VIYFVDEETGGMSAYPVALMIKGHPVKTIPDATRALALLQEADRIDLVIIDVMLARGFDPSQSFRPDQTGRGLQTGLRLLDLLCEKRPDSFPSRAALLSAATDEQLVTTIKRASEQFEIPYWRKEDFKVTRDFCRAVTDHLESFAVRVGERTEV
jgi:CheY-like chemotaxis protein